MIEAEAPSTSITTSGCGSNISTSNASSKLSKCFSTMMHYVAEIIILVLIFTSYASLQKGALKVGLQPPPVPFFETNSSVDDYYNGEISTPFLAVAEADVSLVMYYAPWDFDSQMARNEIEEVANQFSDQVYFAAINCWYWYGECHQHFPRIRSFPLLLAYVGGQKGIQYRGPLRQAYIYKFLKELLRPLERVGDPSDVFRLLAKANAVVTGYFNFEEPKPTGFKSFYVASSRYLEYDVHRTVVFAAVTNPTAAVSLGIDPTPPNKYDIRLHLWNETLIYPHNGNTTVDVDRLLPWIYHRSHSPIQWLSPTARKSRLIQEVIFDQQRASLVLFTPRMPDSTQLMIAKEVALDYHNCAFSPRITRLVEEIQNQRQAIDIARSELENKCSIFASGLEKSNFCRGRNASSCWSTVKTSSLWTREEDCPIQSSSRQHPIHFSDSNELNFGIRGLGCRTNRSLSFFAMDSELYPEFAARLGYSLDQMLHNPTVAFIVDPEDESHFAMTRPMTRENLEQFVLGFTTAGLQRLRRSQLKGIGNNRCDEAGRLCIHEIAGSQFEDVVLRPSSDVLVFYRKGNCIFCDTAARLFLKVALMLQRRVSQPASSQQTTSDQLSQFDFVMVDAEENDLPWPYTVDRYPTVVFYPAYRKTESRMFPREMELTVGNLLNFTLRQLHPKKRVMWFVRFCRDVACWNEAQRRISFQVAVIEQHLRSLQSRLLRTDQNDHASLLQQMRQWDKERRFYRQLNLTVLESVAHFRQQQQETLNRYPNGIRFTDD